MSLFKNLLVSSSIALTAFFPSFVFAADFDLDIYPPTISNGKPSGFLPKGTTQIEMSVDTNENAICKYDDSWAVPYESMSGAFSVTGATHHTVLLTGLVGGYHNYYVKCADSSDNVSWFDYWIYFQIPDSTPPSVPANLGTTKVSYDQVDLKWDNSTDNVWVAGYKVYRNDNFIGNAYSNSYWDFGVKPSTTYTYAVAAYDSAGNVSERSSAITVATPVAPDTTPPTISNGKPSGFLPKGTTQIEMSVDTNENAICKYDDSWAVPYESMSGAFSTTGAAHHTVLLTGLVGGYHNYYVKCADSSDNVSWFDYWIYFQIPDSTPPSVPANLETTKVSYDQVDLKWDNSTDNVWVAGYKVYRNDNFIGNAYSNSYWDFGVKPSTTYTYTVSAYDSAGNVSEKSSAITVATPVAPIY